MIRVRLLKAVQPFNAGECCGFTKEQLSGLPDSAYELLDKPVVEPDLKSEPKQEEKKEKGIKR